MQADLYKEIRCRDFRICRADAPETDIPSNIEIKDGDSFCESDFIVFCQLYEQILSLKTRRKQGAFIRRTLLLNIW